MFSTGNHNNSTLSWPKRLCPQNHICFLSPTGDLSKLYHWIQPFLPHRMVVCLPTSNRVPGLPQIPQFTQMNMYGCGPFWEKKDFGFTLNYLFLKAAKVGLEGRKELGNTEKETISHQWPRFCIDFQFWLLAGCSTKSTSDVFKIPVAWLDRYPLLIPFISALKSPCLSSYNHTAF